MPERRVDPHDNCTTCPPERKSPSKIAIVIAHHEGNVDDALDARDSVLHSFATCGLPVPIVIMNLGRKVGTGRDYSLERDTEIWRCRQEGVEKAIAEGAEFFYQVDTDVRVPPDWAWWATNVLPRDAVCFPAINHDTWRARFVDDGFIPRAWDTANPDRASECTGYSKEAYLKMKAAGPISGSGLNEDYELSLSLRRQGYRYTNVWQCPVVAF